MFNSAKYVEADGDGIRLTDYARYHMDECCLSFDIALLKEYGESRYSSICILNREYKSPFEYDIRFTKRYENLTPEERGALLKKTAYEDEELYRKMTNDYVECLRIAKKERDMTYDDIAELIEKDVKTVQRIFSGKGTKLETLVAICLALHLPPKVSSHIIALSPVSFKQGNEEHIALQFALNALYKSSMEKIKEQLENMGIQLV